jgi:CHAD domain-containing protein
MNPRTARWLAPVESLAQEALDQRWERFQAERLRCAANADVDAVHDLRVAIRRLAQALRGFAPLLPGSPARMLRRALRKPLAEAAVVRDLDVGMEHLLALGLAGTHALLAEMREARRRGALALQARLLLFAAREPARGWAGAIQCRARRARSAKNQMPPTAGASACAVLPPSAGDFFAAGRAAATAEAAPAQLHKFRLVAKRFRYTLELFRPLYGPAYAVRIEDVRKVQSLLGDRQDCAVLCARLRKPASDDAVLQSVWEQLDAQGRAHEEKFRRYWHKALDLDGAEAAWVRYFTTLPPGARAAAALDPLESLTAVPRAL